VLDDLCGDLDLASHGVDGDESAFQLPRCGKLIESGRPHRPDPIFETTRESQRIDPVDQGAQPALGRDSMVEWREPPQKIQMILAQATISSKSSHGAMVAQLSSKKISANGKAILPGSRLSEAEENGSTAAPPATWEHPRRRKSRLHRPSGASS
jgi:hypothetical protein